MSTKAEIDDPSTLNEAIQRLRSDTGESTRKAWLIVAHVNNNPNLVQLLAEGEELEECREKLADDQVMYILLRLPSTFDMSATVKFVYIHW